MAKTGKRVNVVLANGKHVQADVIKEHKGDLVDVEFEHHTGEDGIATITKSPLDLTGRKPDSWHPIPEAVADASPEAKAAAN